MAAAKADFIRVDGLQKVHLSIPEPWSEAIGIKEMMEEYDGRSQELLSRRIRAIQGLTERWITQYAPAMSEAQIHAINMPNNSCASEIRMDPGRNPICTRKDTEAYFELRIRQLPGEESNYMVSIDTEKNDVVIRTQDKKFFKRFKFEDLGWYGLKHEPSKLITRFAHQTLAISYKKPPVVLEFEKKLKKNLLATPILG